MKVYTSREDTHRIIQKFSFVQLHMVYLPDLDCFLCCVFSVLYCSVTLLLLCVTVFLLCIVLFIVLVFLCLCL
jgi:hypothetical protein